MGLNANSLFFTYSLIYSIDRFIPQSTRCFLSSQTCFPIWGWVSGTGNGPLGPLRSRTKRKLPWGVGVSSLLSQMLPMFLSSSPQGHRFPDTPMQHLWTLRGPFWRKSSCPHAGRREMGSGAGVWGRLLPMVGDDHMCGHHLGLGGGQDYDQRKTCTRPH